VVDIGRDEKGKRQQITRTFDKLKEARAELSRIRHETDQGTYVKPSEITVNDYLDENLAGATRGRRESTKVSYRDAFRPVRERLGARALQSISKADIENLMDWMLTSDRRRGGKAGTGLGPRSVRLTLGRLKAAFEMAVDEGRLVRNVVKLVAPPEYTPGERATWSRTEVRRFLRVATKDRLRAAWRLSLYGLRRGEVLGLRWSDIDLRAKTLTVTRARVLVDYKVRIEPPKSRNGKWTLPLDDELVSALTELRKRQARESATAGHAYRAGLEDLDWYTAGDEYVVTDELGIPLHPEAYSDEFTRLLKVADLPKIRLHDSRHTTLSLMEKAGVPISIVSKWAGHTTPRSR
jgi:integrase